MYSKKGVSCFLRRFYQKRFIRIGLFTYVFREGNKGISRDSVEAFKGIGEGVAALLRDDSPQREPT